MVPLGSGQAAHRAAPSRLHLLAVGPGHPWVREEGSLLRFRSSLAALAALGDVTYVGVGVDAVPPPGPPDDLPLVAVHGLALAPATTSLWRRWAWRVGTELGLPVRRPLSQTLAGDLSDLLVGQSFDVAWVMTLAVHRQVEGALRAVSRATVLDLIDWPGEWPGGMRPRLRKLLARATRPDAVNRFKLADRLRRDAAEARRAVRGVDRAVASSVPVGAPSALAQVVNVYPARALTGARPSHDPPRILFAGTFGYPPNVEAAEVLTRDVLPLVRRDLPEARVRIVGRHEQNVEHLGGQPGVELVGYVDDMEVELANADLVVVPLRRGTGTRLKILEAWSHQVPVVSTSVGAAGLGADPGRHLLLADAPDELASACVRALTDQRLRAALVTAAHAHLDARFSQRVLDEQIRRVVEAARARRP